MTHNKSSWTHLLGIMSLIIILVVITTLMTTSSVEKKESFSLPSRCDNISAIMCSTKNVKVDNQSLVPVLNSMEVAYKESKDSSGEKTGYCERLKGCVLPRHKLKFLKYQTCDNLNDPESGVKFTDSAELGLVNDGCYLSTQNKKKFKAGLEYIKNREHEIAYGPVAKLEIMRDGLRNQVDNARNEMKKAALNLNKIRKEYVIASVDAASIQRQAKQAQISYQELARSITNSQFMLDVGKRVINELSDNAVWSVVKSSKGTTLLQRELSIPNVVSGKFTLAYKYCRNPSAPLVNAASLWLNQTNYVFQNEVNDIYDTTNVYRNADVMNTVFGVPASINDSGDYYIYVEVLNIEQGGRLVGWMLFKRRATPDADLKSWFSYENFIDGSIDVVDAFAPMSLAERKERFSIDNFAPMKRLFYIFKHWSGCNRDPTLFVIPYNTPCIWDAQNVGYILMANNMNFKSTEKAKAFCVGGTDDPPYIGYSQDTIKQWMRGDVMHIYVRKVENDLWDVPKPRKQ